MPFVWKGGEEPLLEKRRRERGEQTLSELHFTWLNAVAAGDRARGIEAALEWNKGAGEIYGDDFMDLMNDETEPANDL